VAPGDLPLSSTQIKTIQITVNINHESNFVSRKPNEKKRKSNCHLADANNKS
jgi:hypothetical protein